ERSRAMGVVGAAFGLGLVTGPVIGALTSHLNLLQHDPALARFGFNPYSIPALVSFALCLVNLAWITARFTETLTPAARAESRALLDRGPGLARAKNASHRQRDQCPDPRSRRLGARSARHWIRTGAAHPLFRTRLPGARQRLGESSHDRTDLPVQRALGTGPR